MRLRTPANRSGVQSYVSVRGVLKECVPAAVSGIAFLSGGQEDVDATARLDAMNKMGGFSWKVSFSYSQR